MLDPSVPPIEVIGRAREVLRSHLDGPARFIRVHVGRG
jgi:hypothetical protein